MPSLTAECILHEQDLCYETLSTTFCPSLRGLAEDRKLFLVPIHRIPVTQKESHASVTCAEQTR